MKEYDKQGEIPNVQIYILEKMTGGYGMTVLCFFGGLRSKF